MFQKFKNAFDAIAEDQARQRGPQSSSRGVSAPRRSVSRSGASGTRPGSRVSGNLHKDVDLSGPDPDPSTFDAEYVVGEDDAQARHTSKPNGNVGDSQAAVETSVAPAAAVEPPATDTDLPENGETKQEMSPDVQSKLRKLNKLESKYQELLRAYRKAHARNTAIEPFEARLREITPLTSIADPAAFVEYLQQTSLKGEMAVEELKNVSRERDDLKVRLQDLEAKLQKALDEAASLKQDPEISDGANDAGLHNSSVIPEIASNGPPPDVKPAASSDKQVATQAQNSSEEFFSVEGEATRLEEELRERDVTIQALEQQQVTLQSDLAVAKESAQHMMLSLENAQNDMEALKAEREEERAGFRREIESLSSNRAPPSDDSHGVKQASGNTGNRALAETHLPIVMESSDDQIGKQDDVPRSEDYIDESAAEQDSQKQLLAGRQLDLLAAQKEVEKLSAKLRDQDGLVEEIEQLRDDLVTLGQEHVSTKDEAQSLLAEREALHQKISGLEQKLGLLGAQCKDTPAVKDFGESNTLREERDQLLQEVEALKLALLQAKAVEQGDVVNGSNSSATYDELRAKLSSAETDLAASQQLAASRFKEAASLRDLIQKAQPELAALRFEVTELRGTKEELQVKSSEARRLESRIESLRVDSDNLRRKVVAKDAEINGLNQKLTNENTRRLGLEEGQRKAQREAARVQHEKSELMSLKEGLERIRIDLERELNELRPQVRQLRDTSASLNDELDGLKEQISIKTAQHASAQSLMTSIRDQAAEMSTQLKETKERCESLEEELADAHRLMNERGREGETMRRLLAEVEGRANTRVKDMRERMENAVQERDRAEEEASSATRRKGRELDEARIKVRNLERDLKTAREDRAEFERTERELQRQRDEEQRRFEQATQELAEVHGTISDLRDALDEGERQSKELELENRDSRKALEEVQARLEKLQAANKTISEELKTIRAARTKQTGTISSRPSESSLPGRESSQSRRTVDDANRGQPQSLDFVYLKTVLLQFLEQKDKALQRQLVPVLGMLLRFDKSEERKWVTAVNSR